MDSSDNKNTPPLAESAPEKTNSQEPDIQEAIPVGVPQEDSGINPHTARFNDLEYINSHATEVSLVEPDEEFITLDENGQMIAVHLHTGETRFIEENPAESTRPDGLPSFRKVIDIDGNLVYVPKRISAQDLRAIQGERTHLPYSPLLAERICQMVAEGRTLVDISKLPGFPRYAEISRWRREYPEFDQAFKDARQDRGEFFFDRMLKSAEAAGPDRDEVALAKMKSDVYKFAARVSKPDDFAEKTINDNNHTMGPIVVDTGIRRETDANYNRDETKLIREANADAGTEE